MCQALSRCPGRSWGITAVLSRTASPEKRKISIPWPEALGLPGSHLAPNKIFPHPLEGFQVSEEASGATQTGLGPLPLHLLQTYKIQTYHRLCWANIEKSHLFLLIKLTGRYKDPSTDSLEKQHPAPTPPKNIQNLPTWSEMSPQTDSCSRGQSQDRRTRPTQQPTVTGHEKTYPLEI